MKKAFSVFDFIFTLVWQIQKLIMKFSLKINNYLKYKNFNKHKKAIGILMFLDFIIMIIFCLLNYNNLFTICAVIFLICVFMILHLSSTIKAFLSPFTSIRYFFLISVIYNGLFYWIIYAYSGISYIIILIGFALIFCVISLLSNTEISKTANALIELILGIGGIVTKIALTSFYKSKYAPQLIERFGISIGEVSNVLVENIISSQIDTYLYPLLIINGIALIICTFHSYWIIKYNNGKQITWDKKLIKKYINQ